MTEQAPPGAGRPLPRSFAPRSRRAKCAVRQRATLPPRSGHDACHPHGQFRTNGARHGDAARHGRWAPRMQTRRRDMRLSRDMSRQSVVLLMRGRPQLLRAPAPASYLCMQLAVSQLSVYRYATAAPRGARRMRAGRCMAIQSEEEPSRSIPSGRSSVLLPHADCTMPRAWGMSEADLHSYPHEGCEGHPTHSCGLFCAVSWHEPQTPSFIQEVPPCRTV